MAEDAIDESLVSPSGRRRVRRKRRKATPRRRLEKRIAGLLQGRDAGSILTAGLLVLGILVGLAVILPTGLLY